jgi:hypothetical protein
LAKEEDSFMSIRMLLGTFLTAVVVLLAAPCPQAAAQPAATPAMSAPQVGSLAYNERLAPEDLAAILAAQTAFHGATGRHAAAFSELATPAQGAPCLPGSWDAPRRGYLFRLSSTDQGQSGFSVVAEPWKPGVTGKRCFFADQTGTIRVNEGGAAGPESPSLADSPLKTPPPLTPALVPQQVGTLRRTLWRLVGYQPPGVREVGLTRAVIGAQVAYNSAMGRYAETIDEMLAPSANPAFLDSNEDNLAWPMVAGCRFVLMPVPDPAASFVLIVEPVDPATSGNRWLYTDQSGVIRWSGTPEVGPDSPPISW